MKSRFSKRYGYDPKQPKEPILEDAPAHTRMGFIQSALNRLLYVDEDSRYRNEDEKPLGIKGLYQDLAMLMRAKGSDDIWDSWHCHEVLIAELESIPWYHFYDFVELIAQRLIRRQTENPFSDFPEEYSFEQYRERVNEVLVMG